MERGCSSRFFVSSLLGIVLGGPSLNASTCHDSRDWIRIEDQVIYADREYKNRVVRIVPADVETPEGEKITDAVSALAYLQKDRALLDPACIETALDRVALEQYKPAIPTLLHYLDFLPPRNFPFTHHMGPTGGEYPGVEALSQFDEKDVLSGIQKVIRDDDVNTLSRVNAAILYFFKWPDGETIRFIVRVAQSAIDPASSQALLVLAETAVKYCPISEREECKKAFETQAPAGAESAR